MQAYHALSARITSLYWFNLSLQSLLKFPDLMDPLMAVGREIRMLDELYLTGSPYRYERLTREGELDWDLASIIGPRGALLFALDLDYEPDLAEKVFRFGEPRDVKFTFELPTFLRDARRVVRVDAEGMAPVEFETTPRGVTIRDRLSRVGVYLATSDDALIDEIERKRQGLIAREAALEFDPARDEEDLATLRGLVPQGER